MTPRHRLAVVWLLAAWLLPGLASGEEIFRIPFEEAVRGTPAIGGALKANPKPYIGSADQYETDLVPLYLYEGEHVFARGTSIGAHLWESEGLVVDLLGQYRFTQLRPDEEDLDGLEPRKSTLEVGLRATLTGPWGRLQAQWLTDALDYHGGEATEVSYGFPMRLGRWWITPWLSYEWQSAELVDYYFGVSGAEAEASGIPAYSAGRAGIFGWGINTGYRITDNVIVFANLGQYRLDDSIADSPLSFESMQDMVYAGTTVAFGQAYAYGRRDGESRPGLWTWRVNAGYAAEGNIVGDVSEGDLRPANELDSPIIGVTLSRLVRPGPRVDIYGRFSLFRHFEEGSNDSFSSYAAYVMAIGKSYFSWSDQEAFRFGFGFGASYASRVPAFEKIKQARRDRNTNHLLTYLELSVDTPMANFTRARSVRNCYAGATVVHRSGIFGYSSMLGNVAGGSNWITLSLECKR